jgi:TRAP transporter TAXI family solute receptor
MKKLACILGLVVIMGISFFANVCNAQKAKPAETIAKQELPEILTMSSYGVGTGAYVVMSGFREAIEKYTPMKARLEPYADDVGRVRIMKDKMAYMAILSAGSVWPCAYGRWLWSTQQWGPQPIRELAIGNPLPEGFYVKGNSDIYKIADLKGKRVPKVIGAPGTKALIEAKLAFANLTWKDVIPVPVQGWAGQSQGIIENITDVVSSDPGGTDPAISARLPGGIRWLPIPLDDKVGWARLMEKCPWARPWKEKSLGLSQGLIPPEGYDAACYPYLLVCYDWIPDHLAYVILKALDSGYESFKNMHRYAYYFKVSGGLPDAPGIPKDVSQLQSIPFHPGAIKFYKEKNLWGPQHDEWQAKMLREESARIAEFKANPEAWAKKYKD